MCIFRKLKEKKKKTVERSQAAMISVDEDDSVTVGFFNETNSRDDDSPTVILGMDEQQPRVTSVTLTDEKDSNRFYKASIENSIVIGKDSSTCAIAIINDSSVSRKHCTINQLGNDLYLTDGFAGSKSTNGTYVNGTKIVDKTKIVNGDVITIGRGKYIFTVD